MKGSFRIEVLNLVQLIAENMLRDVRGPLHLYEEVLVHAETLVGWVNTFYSLKSKEF